MRKVLIIGMGAGDPEYLTLQAIDALNAVDVFFIPNKGAEKEGLRRLRTNICERFATRKAYRCVELEALRRDPHFTDYRSNVGAWHARIADQYEDLLTRELDDGQCAGFLVWGDPGLYDSTLRIIEMIEARGSVALDYEVVPGISSVQALAAKHRIPLNRIGEPVVVTTGRKLRDSLPDGGQTTVVMLDGEQAFARLEREDLHIYWGAYLGTPDEILISGRLADVRAEILRRRESARRAKGWIMDTYLLRSVTD